MIVPILQMKKLSREVKWQNWRADPDNQAAWLLTWPSVGRGVAGRGGAGRGEQQGPPRSGNFRWKRRRCPLRRSHCNPKPEPWPRLMK